MICAFKSLTIKLANQRDNTSLRQIWQRSYHDHIIRGGQEYQKIRKHIGENPPNWTEDCLF